MMLPGLQPPSPFPLPYFALIFRSIGYSVHPLLCRWRASRCRTTPSTTTFQLPLRLAASKRSLRGRGAGGRMEADKVWQSTQSSH